MSTGPDVTHAKGCLFEQHSSFTSLCRSNAYCSPLFTFFTFLNYYFINWTWFLLRNHALILDCMFCLPYKHGHSLWAIPTTNILIVRICKNCSMGSKLLWYYSTHTNIFIGSILCFCQYILRNVPCGSLIRRLIKKCLTCKSTANGFCSKILCLSSYTRM